MNKQATTISDKVLKKIKNDDIKPLPRWHFLLRHGFLWILLAILLTVGAIAFGISYFELTDIEWDLRPRLGLGLAQMTVSVFPYFWVAVAILVGLLAYYNFVNTPKGYRYPRYQVIVFGLLLVLMTGLSIHYLGWARSIRDKIDERAPWMQMLRFNKERLYQLPEKGLLVGELIKIENNLVTIKSVDGIEWRVDIKAINLPADKKLSEGQRLIVIGQPSAEHEFTAREIRPWQKGQGLKLRNLIKNNKLL